jgi:phosphohistidine swiveling domain-containing protein
MPKLAFARAYTLSFDAPEAADRSITGGKGCSLANLLQADFPIPPGYVITTEAFRGFMEANALHDPIAAALAQHTRGSADDVLAASAAIRKIVEDAEIPEDVARDIVRRYRALAEDDDSIYVAVRSSGTAEDSADASFAGQHDTELDVRGDAELLQAVRRCWSSVWAPRAIAYRRERGFSEHEMALAVVVMQMIESKVAGVLFTANPVTSAVDEYVVNAVWGLGEGLVAGLANPDQFVLDRESLAVVHQVLGSKEVRVTRAHATGRGTCIEAVPELDRGRFALGAAQLAELGALGRRITAHYGNWPQDIEWAWSGSGFFVLQSRDVTGIPFSWDEDLESHGDLPRLARSAILSRARADTVWTGRITPLFYSLRSEVRTLVTPDIYSVWAGHAVRQRRWGRPGIEIGQLRWYKYHRGAVYFNSEVEYRNHLELIPPAIRRPELCEWTPPSWVIDIRDLPGSWRNILRVLARITVRRPRLNPLLVFRTLNAEIGNGNRHGAGLRPEAIRELSDDALREYVHETIRLQYRWVRDIAYVFYLYAPVALALFTWMIENWYAEGNATLTTLVTGLPRDTYTVLQNRALQALADEIRASDEMQDLLGQFKDAEFFSRAEGSFGGTAFTEKYRRFLRDFGHRGHADRDIWYERRCEDPSIDYRTLALLVRDDVRPAGDDREVAAKRVELTQTVVERIRRQPGGMAKAAVFRLVHSFILDFFAFRDDSRHHTDLNTFAKKQAVQEVGRRLFERRVLRREDDFYYLSKDELLELLCAPPTNRRLLDAKIEARRRNCDRYRKEWFPPMYIRGDGTTHEEESAADAHADDESGVLRGLAMSQGRATGTARIVSTLEEIGRLRSGEILIARSTDPGWTPAFGVVKALVLETGGTLSHGAQLSREYGLPAVQLAEAMMRIPDGATIRVDGDTGEVRVLPETTMDDSAEAGSRIGSAVAESRGSEV